MFRFAVCAILVCSFSAFAQQDERLRVIGTVPLPGDPINDQIVLFFDQPIQVPEKPAEEPDEWFSIAPRVRGQKIIGENYVVFRPDSPQAESVLRLRLSDALVGRNGAALEDGQREWAFAPFRFEPGNLWIIEDAPGGMVLGLWFPAPVDLDAVREHLSVSTAGGVTVDTTVERSDDDQVVRVILPGDTRWPVRLTVAAGLQDRAGELTQTRPRSFTYPETSVLAVYSVDWGEYNRERQTVVFDFSREVDPVRLQEFLSLRDGDSGQAVPYTLVDTESASVHVARLTLNDPSQVSLQVTINAGLPGGQETTLPEAYSTTLGQSPRPLLIQYHYWNHSGKDGLMLVVSLSQSVELPALRDHVQLEPALPDMRIEPLGGQQFAIYGQWDSKKTYALTITEGLEYWIGAKLPQAIQREVTTGDVPAWLGFGYAGKYYFPRRSGGAIPVESRNVTRANVTLHRVFPSNLLVALDDLRAGSPDPRFVHRWSEEIAKSDVMLPIRTDRLVESGVDVDSVLPSDMRGVFCMVISAPKTGTDRKVLVMTDIGALAHWSGEALTLHTHHLITLEALPGAQVTLYSNKNQLLGRTVTDAQGLARFDQWDSSLGLPRLAVIEKDQDFTFLELEDRDGPATDVDWSMPGYQPDRYDAFVYGDRNLYRPGETVHLRWTVRENYGDAVANVPLQMRLRMPNGRLAATETITLNEFGAAGFDFESQRVHPTGNWQAEITVPGSETLLGTYAFQLEDFVPNRMKATVHIEPDRLRTGESYTFTVKAEHLFGAPAANRNAEGKVYFERARFTSPQWQGFVFTNDDEFEPDPIDAGELMTDENGEAAFSFTYRATPEVTFPLKATIVGRVLELGGRAVSDHVERVLVPSDIMMGVTAAPATGGGVEVFAAAINADETPAALNRARVTLEREEWRYNVRRYYDGYEPHWTREFIEVETRDVALADGRGSTVFPVSGYGYYQVRVHAPETPQFSTAKFYAYRNQVELVDTARPSLVKLTRDRDQYAPGDNAVIRIEAPFDGVAFVTLLGPELRDLPPIPIENRVGQVTIPLDTNHVPNVWAEVTVVYATAAPSGVTTYPYASHARINLPCPSPARRLDIAFTNLPSETLPDQTVSVGLQVRDGGGNPMRAEVTLAAVDEGIHAITRYTNPDPYGWLMRPRRPEISRAHYYDRVAYDFGRPRPGGDGVGRALEQRLPFIGDNWIKPVALWSGAVVTDAAGAATIDVPIPEFSGTLRLVAIAKSANALGAAGNSLVVRRPYMLQTSMPRFLITGDTARCRATVFNTTGGAVTARVAWSASGALSGSGAQEIALPAGAESSAMAEIQGAAAFGQGELRWQVTISDAAGAVIDELTEIAPIPVRPPGTFETRRSLIVLEPGQTRTLENTALLDDERTEWRMTVGASPVLRIQRALKALADYPYGCIEQTISQLMPVYLMRQEAALVGSVLEDGRTYESFLNDGIHRLLAMQTPSGGLAMWPGSDDPYPYASVYALHFLTLVDRDGEFTVSDPALEALRRYVRRLAADWSGNNASQLYLRAYAIYTLSLGGDLGALLQIDRFATVPIPETSRHLLTAALAQHSKDPDRVAMFRNGPVLQYRTRETDGNLNSEIRNAAIELIAKRALNAPAAELAGLADTLAQLLDASVRPNTQEMAFAVTALGMYFQDLSANLDQAAATVVGPGGEETVQGNGLATLRHDGPGGQFTISNTGQTPMFVNLAVGGVPLEAAVEAYDEGLGIERRVYTAEGRTFDGTEYAQGATYVIALKFQTRGSHRHVVVADRLPAGFEVENPRLDTAALPPGPFDEGLDATHLEIRDDRLVAVFDSLPSGTTHFYYAVRAVTPGTFRQPQAQGEVMYDPVVRGGSAGRTITVE